MAVGAIVARILTQYSDKGSKAANRDITKLGKQFDAFAKKTAKAFGLAAAAVGAFAIKVGKDAVQAAIADQKSQALLANSLRNTVGASDAAIASVEGYISKLQMTVGVADDELRPALGKLAAVTGDVASAQQLLGIALDVSAFSGSDLGSATQAVTRALQGNFRSLQKLVPSIDTAAIKSKDFAGILAEVQKATQGAAASRAGTLEYKLKILGIRYNEILENLGYKLLPVIEKFADVIQKEVLPQIEKWIKSNEKGLVNSLKTLTEIGVKLIKTLISFANWISQNMGLVKTLAAVIATMWATAKIGAFILGLKSIALAFGLVTVAANGATVATARFKAAASFLLRFGRILLGVFAVLGLAGDAGTSKGGFPKGTVGAMLERENAVRNRQLKQYLKFLKNRSKTAGTSVTAADPLASQFDALLKILNLQKAINAAKKQELSTEQKIVNKMLKKYGLALTTPEIEARATAGAIEANLKKQAALSGSSLLPIGAISPMSQYFNAEKGNPVNIYVSGSVISERDLVDMVSAQLKLRTTAGSPVSGTYLGSNTDSLAFKVRYL